MGWQALSPPTTGIKVHNVKAYVRVLKSGEAHLMLTFSQYFLRQFKDAKQASIMNDGLVLMVKFGKGTDFPFALTHFEKGGARVTLPAFHPALHEEHDSTACRVSDTMPDGFIVALPAEWTSTTHMVQGAPRASSAPPGPPPKEPEANDSRIDVVKYLAMKGYKVQRLAGDRFQVDKELRTKPQVLALINQQRGKTDLPPLKLDEFF